jgi:hypothetical protein
MKGLTDVFAWSDLRMIDRDNALRILPTMRA